MYKVSISFVLYARAKSNFKGMDVHMSRKYFNTVLLLSTTLLTGLALSHPLIGHADASTQTSNAVATTTASASSTTTSNGNTYGVDDDNIVWTVETPTRRSQEQVGLSVKSELIWINVRPTYGTPCWMPLAIPVLGFTVKSPVFQTLCTSVPSIRPSLSL